MNGTRLTLNRMKPTTSLLLCSMPCEQTAAEIRNTTVDSMQQGNVGDIAYRYLQNRRGAQNTLHEIFLWSFLFCLAMTSEDKISYIYKLLITSIAIFPHIIPNVANRNTYLESMASCEEWLDKKLGEQKVSQIKKMNFNRSGIFALTNFLKENTIDSQSVDQRLKNKEIPPSCCGIDL